MVKYCQKRSKWSKIVKNGQKQLNMVKNGQNCQKRSTTVQNIEKLSKTVLSVLSVLSDYYESEDPSETHK